MLHENYEFWIDIDLPSSLAKWIASEFKFPASSFRDLGLETTSDIEIFKKALENLNIILLQQKIMILLI